MEVYITKSPVLFLVFNRPDVTKRVFAEIRKTKPERLYLAADGPRPEKENEAGLCNETRSILKEVDWDCKVFTLFREENLGCKNAVSSALDWFFDHEEEGIILEDDCLPSNSFFFFCDEMLKKYRDDTRIRHVAGSSHQLGKKWGTASLYFANQTHVWGWASWRRVWKDYDKNLSKYLEEEVAAALRNVFNDELLIDSWKKIFIDLKSGKIDTWDYQLSLINYFNNGLSVNPNVNLISNIGFRPDATHTTDPHSKYANLPLESMETIAYPKYVLPEKAADYEVFVRDFDLVKRWKKHNSYKRRFKRFIKRCFTQ
ncbi:hypothetical protein ABIE26_004561 [Pedobacter africanus]|uniref:Uncharacterized protein n=1 Tax=Pedobacter africanus TaxID=151894 RepID=A0ACC6L3G9_9SPHI|nr:nucleotide-diphospho-sugar transferase [Pedobacter africanus]MDR6785970.1 hypothetical protein [Pedobacter africanus]